MLRFLVDSFTCFVCRCRTQRPESYRQSQEHVMKQLNHQLDSSRDRQTSLSLIEWDPQTIALRWARSIIVSLVLAAHNRWLYMHCLATERENIRTWSVILDPKGDTKEINSLSSDKEYSRREFRGTVWSKRELCFMPQYRKCGKTALCWHFICCCFFEVGRTERCSKCLNIYTSASWSFWHCRAPYEVSNPIDPSSPHPKLGTVGVIIGFRGITTQVTANGL